MDSSSTTCPRCGAVHNQPRDLCYLCSMNGGGPDADARLGRMLADPEFRVLRHYQPGDWFALFEDASGAGHYICGNTLTEVIASWTRHQQETAHAQAVT